MELPAIFHISPLALLLGAWLGLNAALLLLLGLLAFARRHDPLPDAENA